MKVQERRKELTDAIDQQNNKKSENREDVGAKGHQALLAKQQQMERVRDAWKISSDHKFGEAFDTELQDKKRLERQEKREKRR